MSSRQRTLGHAAALMTILIWGTTFVSTKVLLRDFTPVTVLFTRFVIGYAFLWCLKPRVLPFSGWKKELLFAGAGLTGVTLYFLLENIALTYTFASNVGIIVAVVPFFTALLAHFLLKGEGFPAVSSWVLPSPSRVSSLSWQTEQQSAGAALSLQSDVLCNRLYKSKSSSVPIQLLPTEQRA